MVEIITGVVEQASTSWPIEYWLIVAALGTGFLAAWAYILYVRKKK